VPKHVAIWDKMPKRVLAEDGLSTGIFSI